MSNTGKPSLVFGSTVFGIVLVAVVGWTLLGGIALGLTSLYAGFLFLWYWGEVEGAEISRFLTCLAGAVSGIGLAWILQALPAFFGVAGMVASLSIVLIAVYAHIMKLLPFVINSATMLFLTVAAAPVILTQSDFTEVLSSAVLGAVFFGSIVFAAKWFAGRGDLVATSKQAN